jgi:predicted CXXCH cytochrome family protein
MKRLITKTLLCSAVVAGLFLVVQGTANAAITGNCVSCHTMHNSQDGTNFTTSTAQDNLLLNGCLGCHQGTSTEIASRPVNVAYSAPIVYTTDAAPTKTLAGGNFYWMNATNDNLGHNVTDIGNPEGVLTSGGPGGSFAISNLSCTACHVGGGHHTGGSGGAADGSSVANSYRFLSGSVTGVEDTDWEYTVASNDHNTYNGNTDTDGTGSISGHCALCHGDFHGSANIGGTSSPWTRHPTDVALPATGEYADYNTYDPQAPVGATTNVTDFTSVTTNQNIVVCTSCHRAHGANQPDMLRWTYSTMNAGSSGTTGCFVCHTSK